jgi:hypothetical protein
MAARNYQQLTIAHRCILAMGGVASRWRARCLTMHLTGTSSARFENGEKGIESCV